GSTCITVSPESKERFAQGHDPSGARAHNYAAPIFVGAGGVVSSVNDMLKFIAANLGLQPGPLTGAMQKTHAVQFDGGGHRLGMAWHLAPNFGPDMLRHSGQTLGYPSLVILDLPHRRGVVVLANSAQPVEPIGWRLLGLEPPRNPQTK